MSSAVPGQAASSSGDTLSSLPSVDAAQGFPSDFPSLPVDSRPPSPPPASPPDSLPSPSQGLRSTSGLMYRGFTQPASRAASVSRPGSQEERLCWICYDGDDELKSAAGREPSGQAPEAAPLPTPSKAQRWIKACPCSLVAHEACLLTWITTYQLSHRTLNSSSPPLSTPVKCPQCATPYRISQPEYRLLNLFERLKRPYLSFLNWSAVGSVFLGLGIAASSYGLWASRCFLGPARWNRWLCTFDPHNSLTSRASLSFIRMFQMSLVGPILILSRTRQLDSVLPFLPISLILSNMPAIEYDLPIDLHVNSLGRFFPPDPALTLCLIPWARAGWNWIWRKVTVAVLRREYKYLSHLGMIHRMNHANLPVPQEQANEAGQAEEDAEQAGQAEEPGMVQVPAGAHLVLNNVTIRGAIEMGMEALFLPGAASMAGSLLLLISRKQLWLRNLLGVGVSSPLSHHSLGVGPQPVIFKNCFSQLVHKLAHAILPHSLLSGQSSGFSLNSWDRLSNSFGLGSMIFDGKHHNFGSDDQDDPVWWRNSIGGGLLIIVRDVLSLTEKVMKLRRLGQRSIVEVTP